MHLDRETLKGCVYCDKKLIKNHKFYLNIKGKRTRREEVTA